MNQEQKRRRCAAKQLCDIRSVNAGEKDGKENGNEEQEVKIDCADEFSF